MNRCLFAACLGCLMVAGFAPACSSPTGRSLTSAESWSTFGGGKNKLCRTKKGRCFVTDEEAKFHCDGTPKPDCIHTVQYKQNPLYKETCEDEASGNSSKCDEVYPLPDPNNLDPITGQPRPKVCVWYYQCIYDDDFGVCGGAGTLDVPVPDFIAVSVSAVNRTPCPAPY